MANAIDHLELVRRYRDAFASFDPGRYEPFLTDNPVYHAGRVMRTGRAAYRQNTGAGRVLYPFGALRTTERRIVAERDWVAVLFDREAITNKPAHYENTYTMFYEVLDGKVATQVELMDFGVSSGKFDIDALGPDLRVPGETASPEQQAEVPDPGDDSPSAAAKRCVLRFLDAHLTFEPGATDELLLDDPLLQVGMDRRPGRSAFRQMAERAHTIFPDGIADRVHHVLVSDGRTVAILVTLRANTTTGAVYENLYGMFFDVHDGRIASMIKVYDNRAADAFFAESRHGSS